MGYIWDIHGIILGLCIINLFTSIGKGKRKGGRRTSKTAGTERNITIPEKQILYQVDRYKQRAPESV